MNHKNLEIKLQIDGTQSLYFHRFSQARREKYSMTQYEAILRSLSTENDEANNFAKVVADSIRKMPRRAQLIVKKKITDIIFDAELQLCNTPTESTQRLEIFPSHFLFSRQPSKQPVLGVNISNLPQFHVFASVKKFFANIVKSFLYEYLKSFNLTYSL